MIRPKYIACVFALVAVLATAAIAQNFGSTGTSAFNSGGMGSSGFGSSGFGSSGFGSGGMGSSGFGSSGFGGSSMGSGGFGSSGFGGSGFGGSSMGSGGFGGSGFGGGSNFGGQGFGGGASGGGQNFVGRDANDMNAAFSQMGQAGTQFFNQMNRNMRRSNSNQRTTQTITNPPQLTRVTLQVAFATPTPTPAAVATNIQTRIASIPPSHNAAQPQVTMEGDTAVLRGVAATESQRLVIERLVMLEPGVRGVRNEMSVTAPATAETLPPAGN